MKHHIITTALIVGAGVAFAAQSQAANTGDVILAFQTPTGTGNTINLEVDLGPVTNFTNATGPLNLGNFGSQLAADYGSSYYTRTDLMYAAFAATGLTGADGYPKKTLFVTDVAPNNQVDNSSTANGTSSSAILGAVNFYNQTGPGSGPENIDATQSGSYTSYDQNGVQFSTLAGLDNVLSGVSNFDLMYPAGTSGATLGGPSQDLGTFAIDPTGTVTFTPTSAPEPASAGLLALGALALGFVRRRA
jgi:hypothetical protein